MPNIFMFLLCGSKNHQFNTPTEDKSKINFVDNTPMTGHTLKKQKDTLSSDCETLLKYSSGLQRVLCY